MRASVIAHPNIALVKYWGKRDAALNLPAADSLSYTLGPFATRTQLTWAGVAGPDRFLLNGAAPSPKVAARLTRFLDLVRAMRPGLGAAEVVSANDFPTAAGLASSASAFAALALAAVRAGEVALPTAALSALARQGSGSAARSLFGGYVHMHAGQAIDGSDAYATPLFPAEHWPLEVVIVLTTEGEKEVPSTEGMNHTEATSPYYGAWIETVPTAIVEASAAIARRDFEALAHTAEASALQMHASAIAATPGVLYWRGATIETLHAVRALRRQGLAAFFTIDAGPHVKVFCLPEAADKVAEAMREVPGVRGLLRAEAGGAARVLEAAT